MSPLDRLLAEAELRRLVTAYSRAVDRRDLTQLASLFAPQAVDDHGAAFQSGREAFVAYVAQALTAYRTTCHYVLNCHFEIAGQTASGEVHKLNQHITHDGFEVLTGSRSHDRYVQTKGVWRFLSRRVTLDWSRKTPLCEAKGDPAAQAAFGTHGPDDPLYSLPLMAPFGTPWGQTFPLTEPKDE